MNLKSVRSFVFRRWLARRPLLSLVLASSLAASATAQGPASAPRDLSVHELQARIEQLGRSVEAAEALRAIKRLQWAYGHYSEFGLWHDFADLFADTGVGHYTQGDLDREEIRALFFDEVGQGRLGLADGRIYPHISFSPVLSLADDASAARGRFRILAMLGGFGGNAIWFHGVYENAYVNERGVWKINEVSNAAQVSGSFTAGLSTQAGSAPVIPFHYAAADVGRTALPPTASARDTASASETGTTPSASDLRQLAATLSAVQQRLDRLEDEAAVLRLQHRYGYYRDRRDWDGLAALFAEQGRFEHGLRGVYIGRASIRRALNQFGDAPLPADVIGDHILLQPFVSVAPDGRSAKARVDELGLEGTPGVDAQWTQGIYENTFVNENGEWRIDTVRYYPRLITDYAKGWGADARPAPGPSEAFPPDAPPTEQYGVYPQFHIPAFHFAHPVTGRPPQYPEGDPAANNEIGFADVEPPGGGVDAEPSLEVLQSTLAEAEAAAHRSRGYDAVENLIDAYAYYVDECMTADAAALFIDEGEIRIGDGARGTGLERIASALSAACPADRSAGDITLHHVTQPVIDVAEDGSTAQFAARLWEVHVAADDEDYYRGGVVEGEARYEDGRWKLTVLETRYVWTAPIVVPR